VLGSLLRRSPEYWKANPVWRTQLAGVVAGLGRGPRGDRGWSRGVSRGAGRHV